MDALLEQRATREPLVPHPVADLPLHIAPFRIALVDGGRGFGDVGEVGAVNGNDATEFAGQKFSVTLAHGGIEAPAIAMLKGEAFLFREARCFHDGFHARYIHGHRFLGENVFPCLDRRAHVLGAEAGRGGEQHHIHAAFDHFLKSIQPGKLPLLRNFQPALKALQVVQRLGDLRIEDIADGPQDGVVICSKRLACRTCAASAAAD